MNNPAKIVLTISFVLFLSLGFFPTLHVATNMDMDTGSMSNCLFMSDDAKLCAMDFLAHLVAWQSMFSAFAKSGLTETTALILLLATLVYIVVDVPPMLLAPPLVLSYFSQLSQSLFRPFQELFSNGILHPKYY